MDPQPKIYLPNGMAGNLKPTTFPRIMLVDMNSFFASVEQQANPKLRNRPVGVCASLHKTSCLIAASKEAKRLGIKTSTLIYQAKKICPNIILLEADPDKYREVNHRLVKIFREYTDRVEVYSIDEAFLDLRGHPSVLIGAEIKRRIRSEIGEWLTCSVGIGQNKFLAKLAADLPPHQNFGERINKSPDSMGIVWRENLPQIYKNKKLRDLWGVSYGWESRLNKLGITSPLQLLNYPVQNLISLFGKPGFYIWQRVNGLEKDEINSNIEYRPPRLDGESRLGNSKQYLKYEILNDQNSFEPLDFEFRISDQPKSFGHSWVLNFRTTDKTLLKPVIMRLAEKAARRMRAANFQAYGIHLSFIVIDRTFFAKSKKLDFPIDSGLQFYNQSLNILNEWDFTRPIFHVAVSFTNLAVRHQQLSLFNKDHRELTEALDAINNKYGEFTVRSGLLTNSSDFAPDAIAFGR